MVYCLIKHQLEVINYLSYVYRLFLLMIDGGTCINTIQYFLFIDDKKKLESEETKTVLRGFNNFSYKRPLEA